MGKNRLPRARFASVIRTAIADARFDAELWGVPVEDGNDSPRHRESQVNCRVGGSWSYGQGEIYKLAYGRVKLARIEVLWEGRSPEEIRAAKETADRNWMLRVESWDERETRLLRERVEAMEKKQRASAALEPVGAE